MKENLNNKLLHQDFNSDDNRDIEPYLKTAAVYAATENAIAVFSDLKMNRSHIFYGGFGEYLGMAEKGTYRCIDTGRTFLKNYVLKTPHMPAEPPKV